MFHVGKLEDLDIGEAIKLDQFNPPIAIIRGESGEVYAIDEKITALAGGNGTSLGTGGMVTKLNAAKICMDCGCDMIITNGANPEKIYDIMDGKSVGTKFFAEKK